MKCIWDEVKNQVNQQKHGLSFDEASQLFALPEHLILEEYDYDHSADEDRVRSIGPISRGVIVVISIEHENDQAVRLISARIATPIERRRYADLIAGV